MEFKSGHPYPSDIVRGAEDAEVLVKKPMQTFHHYQEKAFHTEPPPLAPTWLYAFRCTRGGYGGHGTLLRATVWFIFVVIPFAYFVWDRAVRACYVIMTYQFVMKVCLAQLLINVLINVLSPWPRQDEPRHPNNPEYVARIGCIVPCHKSAEEIVDTVESLLIFLKPAHIVVVDNGNSVEPLDDTARRIQELDPGIRYLWVPVGMKTNALWMGLHALPSTADFVMHVDDDTVLPPDMVFDDRVWEHEKTEALSYGIAMFQTGTVEKLVDLEFKVISQFRHFQSEYSTVWAQHGIIGIWRREAFTRILKEHPFLPFGEDNWNGTINLLKNRQMRQEIRSCVSTYAPPVLLPGTNTRQQGYGATSLWKQRAERWCINAPRRTLIRLYLLLFYRHDAVRGNVFFRLSCFMHLLSMFANFAKPVTVFAYLISGEFDACFVISTLSIYYFSGMLTIAIQNYFFWRHRPDIQVELKVVLLWPCYKLFLGVCDWYGHWRCFLHYVPFVPSREAFYTEGSMTPELLKQFHGIETVQECPADGLPASPAFGG